MITLGHPYRPDDIGHWPWTEEALATPETVRSPAFMASRHMVLLSGGQDSTTVLALAVAASGHTSEHRRVSAVSLNYGQRHAVELSAAQKIADHFKVDHYEFDCDLLRQLGGSALLAAEQRPALLGSTEKDEALPNTWVPHRNSIMLSAIAAVAARKHLDASYLWIGCTQVDYSGYPDCRRDFLLLKELEINESEHGGKQLIRQVVAPLLDMSKAQIFAAAAHLGALDVVLQYSRTCYAGSQRVNAWGYGCAACAACKLRAQGYAAYQEGLHQQAESVTL